MTFPQQQNAPATHGWAAEAPVSSSLPDASATEPAAEYALRMASVRRMARCVMGKPIKQDSLPKYANLRDEGLIRRALREADQSPAILFWLTMATFAVWATYFMLRGYP